MDFGTKILPDKRIEFNFWAPDSKTAQLCIKNHDMLPMDSKKDGWFQVVTDLAKSASAYMFRIDNGMMVPDPASRCQIKDVHDESLIIDPDEFDWENDFKWKGRPWIETVIYEIHTGTFSNDGTFRAIEEKLDYFISLGITAIELMPVADFPGKRNWGYDGVLLFAPDKTYGTPNDLKNLVKTAHKKGLMVFLDVVYNHFGPEGNYLHVYAKSKFFNPEHKIPWGDAINFKNRNVRNFYIQNALYWLEEYHFDGLRFDAVHTIKDVSNMHILKEISRKIKGEIKNRNVHLILENDVNQKTYLKQNSKKEPEYFTAQWNDDFHHAAHVLLTGESSGYYEKYTDKPVHHLAKTLAQGFTKNLSSTSFINFLQNHDQAGNRFMGERITKLTHQEALKAVISLYLLSPSVPLLFMGEEFGCEQPFYFFCDLEEKLSKSVKEGRLKEFSHFLPPTLDTPNLFHSKIPDVTSEKVFIDSKLNWDCIKNLKNNKILNFYKKMLEIRKKHIIPLIPEIEHSKTKYKIINDNAFWVKWKIKNGEYLWLTANLANRKVNWFLIPDTTQKAEILWKKIL